MMSDNHATYEKIQSWVKEKHGWMPKTCWIAHCKELCGLPVRRAHNSISNERDQPCPPNKQEAIIAAFRHFGR